MYKLYLDVSRTNNPFAGFPENACGRSYSFYSKKGNTMTEPQSPQAGKVAAANLAIGGMHCPACSARVVKALKAVPGVKEAEVSLEARQAKVTYVAGETTPELLEQAITEAGYTFEGAAFS
jgi:copper chaperone CopZ